MATAVIILAGAFATVMILSALRHDHIEIMRRKERDNGHPKDVA